MSPRSLTRVVLHLLLALSLAVPAMASMPQRARTTYGSDTATHNVSSMHAAVNESDIDKPNLDDTNAMPCHTDEEPTTPLADTASEESDPGCCGGDSDAHGCDRAACMHLAWLPHFASIPPLPPTSTRFLARILSPYARHTETLLRPPIA